MPELPEVETVVRSLAPYLPGHKILTAQFFSHFVTPGDWDKTAAALEGSIVHRLQRQGKQILVTLDRGFLLIHLGMTGKLLWNANPGKHARVILTLENGVLVYDDIRHFGRFQFFQSVPAQFEALGPDALHISLENFYTRLKSHKGQLKPLLLNQSFLGGLGNIYVDELLHAAQIHPKTSAARISFKRARLLHAQLGELLDLAIQHRGSSISDYVDGSGQRGNFQRLHRVYGKAGLPCPRCGTPIRRIVIAQRGTHYCPRCQRA